MAVTYIKHHNENVKVYHERDPYFTEGKTSPRYLSEEKLIKNKRLINYEKQQQKKSHATMGAAHIPPPDPRNFLKKGSKTSFPPKPSPASSDKKPCLVLHVPTVKECLEDERRRKAMWKRKNFVRENIQYNLNLKPRTPDRNVVINRYGDKRDVVMAGIDPQFIHNKQFAKIPAYLKKIAKEFQSPAEKKSDEERAIDTKCKYIVKQERENILQGLKANWAECMRKYQTLPILLDSLSKIKRKANLEKQMERLEKDICLVEQHAFIFVYDDEEETHNNNNNNKNNNNEENKNEEEMVN